MNIEVKQVYLHVLEALGAYSDYVVEVLLDLGINALIHRGGKHSALLMVGVVAGKLGAPGSKEFFHIQAFPVNNYFLLRTFSMAAATPSASTPYFASSSL